MFLTIHFTRKEPKDKGEENGTVDLLLYKNLYCLLKTLHTYIGSPHCDKKSRRFLSIYSTDNELKKRQKNCLEHEPCFMKLPKTSFRFTKFYCRISSKFVGVADFGAMKKEDNRMKEKLTKNN